jgi:hypothetical protein
VQPVWTWPKSFQSDKQLIKEPGICAQAKRAIKDTIDSFQSQSNDFSTTQRYPLPTKVLLWSPDYFLFTTQDQHTYVVVTLIVKMPDKKNKKARTALAALDLQATKSNCHVRHSLAFLSRWERPQQPLSHVFLELMPWHFCVLLVSCEQAHYGRRRIIANGLATC